ncbi:MAG: AAA family ATPase [Deltaproteobacteria bacterium]|nr:AAA family ATPase [Deltaproteobacteria bacterium]
MSVHTSRYSPQTLAAETRAELFIGRADARDHLVSVLDHTLREGGARYQLVVGPRGIGKSHLIHLVRDRLEAAGHTIVALGEESHPSSVLAFLAAVLQHMPDVEGLPPGSAQVELLRGGPIADAVARAITLIKARLAGASMLLVVENLDRLLDAIGSAGQASLRGLLQEQGRISILAGSQTLSPAFTRQGAPFFNFFAVEELEPLTVEACREQLIKLARHHGRDALVASLQTPTGLARVRAIHHLAGGTPRAMALVFPYLTPESLDELEGVFLELADELTPYFQEQIRARSPAQQAILQLLAENWSPMTPSDLADATFTSQQSVSGTLRDLKRDHLVVNQVLGRNSYYEIADPLWRIARSMKRPDGIPLAFVRFLRFWLTPRELEDWLTGAGREVYRAMVRQLDSGGLSRFDRQTSNEIEAALEQKDLDGVVRRSKRYYEARPTLVSAFWEYVAMWIAEAEPANHREEIALLLERWPQLRSSHLGLLASTTVLRARCPIRALDAMRYAIEQTDGGELCAVKESFEASVSTRTASLAQLLLLAAGLGDSWVGDNSHLVLLAALATVSEPARRALGAVEGMKRNTALLVAVIEFGLPRAELDRLAPHRSDATRFIERAVFGEVELAQLPEPVRASVEQLREQFRL